MSLCVPSDAQQAQQPAAAAARGARGARRARFVAGSGAVRGRSARHRGTVALYKHRTSLLQAAPAEAGEAAAGAADGGVVDSFAAFTEAAAVGEQLLRLRADEGRSRFLVLPGHPDPAGGAPPAGPAGGAGEAEAVEVRIMVPEIILALGPWRHDSCPEGEPLLPGAAGGAAARAARVCYRRRPCAAQAPDCCVVVVPQASFAACCAELDGWAGRLFLCSCHRWRERP
ncbi:unnamed protein product [Prorocentrum cordatum]|uniref:Uncharacterized protein n=1 Tax=Prorocentrum cordatum TaxID=2364126 RepID=A0ABN9V1G6_9DINO|nr:unnamed protein product [Polarella glacialis]